MTAPLTRAERSNEAFLALTCATPHERLMHFLHQRDAAAEAVEPQWDGTHDERLAAALARWDEIAMAAAPAMGVAA